MSAAVALAVAAPVGAQPVWDIDPVHTSIRFSVRHLGISDVHGTFRKFGGTVTAGMHPTETVIDVSIDAASIDTGNAKRDEHLRSADFLDVGRFPTITFKSKQVEGVGINRWRVTGDLTIRGVTKEAKVNLPTPKPQITDNMGKQRSAAKVTAQIKRRDFGITWNKTLDGGGLIVGETITINIDVQAVRRPEPAA